MKLQKLALLGALLIGMSACSKVETKEYYEKNPEAAKKVVQECEDKARKNKTLEGKELENCQNAAQAMIGSMMGDLMKGL